MIGILWSLLFSIIQIHGYNFTRESCDGDVSKILRKQLTFNSRDAAVLEDKLNYYLYTKNNPQGLILTNGLDLMEVDLELETKIIVFGWLEGHNRPWIPNMKDAYLSRDYYNIIVFGYDYYSDVPYVYAGSVAESLGHHLGNFIINLNLNLKKTHLIGHSLGAQISGFAGKYILKETRETVARISGLDAAGPLFNSNPPHLRLDKLDADFVDAIHTNGYIFGYKSNFAHADFYVNGGIFQPGCKSILEVLLGEITCESVNRLLFCSHIRSIELWIESISSNNFLARDIKTGDQIVMGEDCPITASGVYNLNTNARSPYSRGLTSNQ